MFISTIDEEYEDEVEYIEEKPKKKRGPKKKKGADYEDLEDEEEAEDSPMVSRLGFIPGIQGWIQDSFQGRPNLNFLGGVVQS